jgi:2-(1,2-epoxy-1,2-dihydrophenyl)acetyl-CoA isomerase
MSEEKVLTNIAGRIATLTLNRPAVLNALDLSAAAALRQAVEACAGDPNVDAIILTGVGRGFCVGGDMKAAWAHIQDGGDPRAYFHTLTGDIHSIVMALFCSDKLVIAAVNGIAAGAGMALAAACDIRVASESARFKQGFTSLGLVPLGGWTSTISHLIGSARVHELMLFDPILEADKACELGLVSEVVQGEHLIARVLGMADQILQGAVSARIGGKRLLRSVLLPELKRQLAEERERFLYQSATADFQEGLRAFIEKRTPRCQGSY